MATALSTADPGRMGQQHEARMSGILLAPISGSGRLFGVGDEGMKALDRDGEGRYYFRQVLNTLSKAAPRSVNAIFLCLDCSTPMRERLSVRTAARISTGVQLPHQRLEQRCKKSLERSNP